MPISLILRVACGRIQGQAWLRLDSLGLVTEISQIYMIKWYHLSENLDL